VPSLNGFVPSLGLLNFLLFTGAPDGIMMFTDISLCTCYPARNLSLFSEAPSCECELREKGGCSFTGTEPLRTIVFYIEAKAHFHPGR